MYCNYYLYYYYYDYFYYYIIQECILFIWLTSTPDMEKEDDALLYVPRSCEGHNGLLGPTESQQRQEKQFQTSAALPSLLEYWEGQGCMCECVVCVWVCMCVCVCVCVCDCVRVSVCKCVSFYTPKPPRQKWKRLPWWHIQRVGQTV